MPHLKAESDKKLAEKPQAGDKLTQANTKTETGKKDKECRC
jgi:hypothetical protein